MVNSKVIDVALGAIAILWIVVFSSYAISIVLLTLLIGFALMFWRQRQSARDIESRRSRELKIAQIERATTVEFDFQILCPYCGAVFRRREYSDNLAGYRLEEDEVAQFWKAADLSNTFHHCKSCGKQFYVMDQKTWRIKA